MGPSGYNRICAEVEGGTDGDVITRVDLADAAGPNAAGHLAQLAAAITAAAAASHATECMFVYREGEGDAARWTSAPELPAWPASSGLSRLGD